MDEYQGVIKKGKSRGKGLGFPTANISLSKDISEGIYLSYIKVRGKDYPSLTFIGAAKTFNATEVFSETYILDFDQDIYGLQVNVRLIKKIRDNKKFASSEDLIEQIRKDESAARSYFNLLEEAP